jgi:hypothetical protein
MKNIDYFVNEIVGLGKKSVDGILKYGVTMVDAKNTLADSDYEKFLERTHYAEKSASVRKWICIGNAYLRLDAIADNLPPNWSTIYKLSSLSVDKFDLLERKKVLSPTVTAREIDEALSKKSSSKRKPVKLVLTFDSDVRPDVLKKIHDLIEKSVPTSVCKMNLTDEAEELLSTAMSNSSLLKLAA